MLSANIMLRCPGTTLLHKNMYGLCSFKIEFIIMFCPKTRTLTVIVMLSVILLAMDVNSFDVMT